jgi:hypothetical protein
MLLGLSRLVFSGRVQRSTPALFKNIKRALIVYNTVHCSDSCTLEHLQLNLMTSENLYFSSKRQKDLKFNWQLHLKNDNGMYLQRTYSKIKNLLSKVERRRLEISVDDANYRYRSVF